MSGSRHQSICFIITDEPRAVNLELIHWTVLSDVILILEKVTDSSLNKHLRLRNEINCLLKIKTLRLPAASLSLA